MFLGPVCVDGFLVVVVVVVLGGLYLVWDFSIFI